MSEPKDFEPLPFGDAMWPQFTHARKGAEGCREYWTATRPKEFTRVAYLSHYARIETTHRL